MPDRNRFDPRQAALQYAGSGDATQSAACGLVYVGDQIRKLVGAADESFGPEPVEPRAMFERMVHPLDYAALTDEIESALRQHNGALRTRAKAEAVAMAVLRFTHTLVRDDASRCGYGGDGEGDGGSGE